MTRNKTKLAFVVLFAISSLSSCARPNPKNQASKPVEALVQLGCVVRNRHNGSMAIDLPDNFSQFHLLNYVDNLEELNAGEIELDLAHISNLKSIKTLGLGTAKLTSFNELSKLNSLEHLYLQATPVKELSFLNSLPKLRLLNLSYTQVNSLKYIESCPNLEVLFVSSCRSLNKLGDSIGKLKKLVTLVARDSNFSDLERLDNLPSLKRIYLTDCNFESFRVPRTNLISIALDDCPNLRTLDIPENSSLESLGIRNSKIRSIAFLKNCPNLQFLDISGLVLMDVDHLSQCPLISVNADRFMGSSFVIRGRMFHLVDLYIDDSQIEVVKIDAPKLQLLRMANTKMAEREIESLIDSLPHACDVRTVK